MGQLSRVVQVLFKALEGLGKVVSVKCELSCHRWFRICLGAKFDDDFFLVRGWTSCILLKSGNVPLRFAMCNSHSSSNIFVYYLRGVDIFGSWGAWRNVVVGYQRWSFQCSRWSERWYFCWGWTFLYPIRHASVLHLSLSFFYVVFWVFFTKYNASLTRICWEEIISLWITTIIWLLNIGCTLD